MNEGKCKISDFGLSRFLESQGMESIKVISDKGTPYYKSPELLNEEAYSSKCDIWSLGMLFYEMLYGHRPWTGDNPG